VKALYELQRTDARRRQGAVSANRVPGIRFETKHFSS
jgi:hypothetical protein